jgi:hypothetical protein
MPTDIICNPENPFFIKGPASINFSGGRTSAYMTRMCQLAGSLKDPTVEVIFADTGKEREETYRFLEQCSYFFGFPLVYVAYSYEPSASRHIFPVGETPFELMVKKEKYLPNPVQRICTDRLKIKQIHKYMKARYGQGYEKVIGFRADEPSRVFKIRNAPDGHRVSYPLYSAGIDKQTVNSFWRAQPFDLELREWEGNCDLCFLKGVRKRRAIMRDKPELAQWWVRIEHETAATFRAHGKNYLALLKESIQEARQLSLFTNESFSEPDLDDLSDCLCTD